VPSVPHHAWRGLTDRPSLHHIATDHFFTDYPNPEHFDRAALGSRRYPEWRVLFRVSDDGSLRWCDKAVGPSFESLQGGTRGWRRCRAHYGDFDAVFEDLAAADVAGGAMTKRCGAGDAAWVARQSVRSLDHAQHHRTGPLPQFQIVYELERRHEIAGQPGSIMFDGFVNRGRMEISTTP
jgi:hypothetical protein